MATGAMGVIGEKFGAGASAAYSCSSIFAKVLPIFRAFVMGSDWRESSRGWMEAAPILWGGWKTYRLAGDAVLSDR